MIRHHVVVIGASAGGIGPLRELVSALPGDLDAALFVVLHMPPNSESRLPAILNRSARLLSTQAMDGEPIEPGRLYVGRPGHHLTFEGGQMRVGLGPKENRHRPSIDVLFRSAAEVHGDRVVAIVLSGTLDDGALGLAAVKAAGGMTMAQDPAEAPFPDMPINAVETGAVDHCARVAEMAELLVFLVSGDTRRVNLELRSEQELEKVQYQMPTYMISDHETPKPSREPSEFTCPECHGTLWSVGDNGVANSKQYVCRVGHAYTEESLFGAQAEALEAALWAARRALEERFDLAQRMSENAERLGRTLAAEEYRKRGDEAAQSALTIDQALQLFLGDQETGAAKRPA